MGEVYRARDTRLGREVAIKVLSSDLSASPQLRERFEREARAMSQLTHPHICTLYDVGHQEGIDFLVMEYLEGETLADRLTRGPLPLAQLLRYEVEIAEALDKAHRHGLIHRDLKPGNIMLTKSGAKILDFGLAKYSARETDPGKRDSSQGQTEQKPLTEEGTLLGTIQYMAPEQLEGREADARTDIFALGSVLYEMATGKRAFEGKSRASLIASIMDHDPSPISTIQRMIPPALGRIVRTCLEKDPDERWQSARDVARELKWISESSAGAEPFPSGRKTRTATKLVPWIMAVAATAAAIFLAMRMRAPQDAVPVVRAFIPPPPNARFVTSSLASLSNNAGPVAISPDGRAVVFSVLTSEGKSSLWVRPLNQLHSRALAGTEGASYPFWSADSQQVGFFAEGKLKKIAVSGGPPQTICEAGRARGGTWNASGVIIVSPGSRSALFRVEASGGEPKALTTLVPSRGDFSHRWPFFLPDNDHFLYLVQSVSRDGSGTKGVIHLSSLSTSREKHTSGDRELQYRMGERSPAFLP